MLELAESALEAEYEQEGPQHEQHGHEEGDEPRRQEDCVHERLDDPTLGRNEGCLFCLIFFLSLKVREARPDVLDTPVVVLPVILPLELAEIVDEQFLSDG